MAEATQINIGVTWKEGTAHNGFTFDPSPNVSLPGNSTGTANYVINFTLGGPDGAVWDTTPVLWVPPDKQPPPLQSGFTLPTPETNQIQIGVSNHLTSPEAEPITFGFHLFVRALERSWESPDPELTLDPP